MRAILESNRKKTRPRKLDLYEVFCGVFKKRLPVKNVAKGFSKMENIYYHFQILNKKNGEEASLLVKKN